MKRSALTRRGLIAGASVSALATPAIVRAQGQNGVALVIGNSKYKWEATLPNVKRDAPDVAKAFQALGLKTELVQDAGLNEMSAAIEKFKASARGARFAAFYYAGHGATWDKDTYLVPQDADLGDPAAVAKLIRVEALKDATSGAAHRLLVLDNCRNNPAGGWRQREAVGAARADASDLAAAILNEPNTLVLFSTARGRVALDGPPGENSPFAAAFLRQLEAESVDLQGLAGGLRRDLLLATECRQVLFDINSYAAPFVLKGAGKRSAGRAAPNVDPARIVELPNAYAFARQKNLVLPAGLVALRAPAGSPHAQKVGAYEFSWTQTIRGSGHLEPVVFVVLAVNGERAETVNASRTYGSFGDGARWSYTTTNAREDRIGWASVGDWYRLELKWKDANSGSYSSVVNKAKGGGGVDWPGETRPFKRLDG